MSATTTPSTARPESVAVPRVSRRRAVLTVAAGLTACGALVGALWAWLAPPVGIVVGLTRGGERVRGYLGSESDQIFLGSFLLPGMMAVAALVAAAAVWRWRAHRGPQMVGALTLGTVAGTAVAAGVGAALARWRYGEVDLATAPVSPEHRVFYTAEAAPVFFGHSPALVAVTLVFPAGLAALAYAVCVLSTPRDDLGAWPPVAVPYGTPGYASPEHAGAEHAAPEGAGPEHRARESHGPEVAAPVPPAAPATDPATTAGGGPPAGPPAPSR